MSVIAVLLWATAAYAQKPNFSGKWAVNAEKTAAANPNAMAGGGGGGGGRGGGRGGGGSFEVKQDANTLTRTAIMQDGSAGPATVYKLDGTESKNMQAGRGGGDPVEVISVAKWVGNTIEIVTKGANGDTKAVWSMDGADLKIATTTPPRQGGEAMTRTTIYSKG
jgi:hypothetical protein